MNILLEKYLQDKYPKIITSSLSDGLSCGDGWFFIIDTVCETIQRYIDNPPYLPIKGYKKIKYNVKQMWNLTLWNKFFYPILRKLPFKYYTKYSKYFQFDIASHEPAPLNYIPQVIFTQVKEKFSGLRIYYYGGDAHVHSLITLAANFSYKTCEVCGVINTTVGVNEKGWQKTTCKKHTKYTNNFVYNVELDNIFKQINNK